MAFALLHFLICVRSHSLQTPTRPQLRESTPPVAESSESTGTARFSLSRAGLIGPHALRSNPQRRRGTCHAWVYLREEAEPFSPDQSGRSPGLFSWARPISAESRADRRSRRGRRRSTRRSHARKGPNEPLPHRVVLDERHVTREALGLGGSETTFLPIDRVDHSGRIRTTRRHDLKSQGRHR